MLSGSAKPIFMAPDAGRVLPQIGVTHMLTGQQTGGAFYLFEASFGPHSGNGLHVHALEDETVYVLQGVVQARLSDGVLESGVGGVVHLPRGVPHALYNPSETPLRLLALATPAGLESFFDELEAALEDGRMNVETRREISGRYGIEWLE